MSELKLVPVEMLQIVPSYNGDRRLLNFYLKKCQYVYDKYKGDDEQNEYLMHALTSRLTENAAVVVSGREDLTDFEKLKVFLELHFGDYRSEEFSATDLNQLKITPGESFADFCNRIRVALYVLVSKVVVDGDEKTKDMKIDAYKKNALQVFLFNLPIDLMRIVRLKGPATLDAALEIVLDETSFYRNYESYNKRSVNIYSNQGFNVTNNPQGGVFGASQSVTPNRYSNSATAAAFGAPQATAFGASQATAFGASQPASVPNQNNFFGGNSKPGTLFGSGLKPTNVDTEVNKF